MKYFTVEEIKNDIVEALDDYDGYYCDLHDAVLILNTMQIIKKRLWKCLKNMVFLMQ